MHQDVIASTGLAFLIIGLAVLTARKTKFSPIPILIIFGMLAGPQGPWNLLSSTPVLEFLSRVGVLLLLLYMGLEFSMSALVSSGKSILTGGTIYVGLNLVRGALLGLVFFGPSLEALVAAGITTVSSSAIVTKIIMDLKRTANRETEMIMGLIMYEDIFVAVFLAVISSLALTGTADLTVSLISVGKALLFMSAFILLGRKAPQHVDRLLNFKSDEDFLVITFGLLLLVAAAAEIIHVAEAVSALLVGLVIAETTHKERAEKLTLPMRDLFATVFFFSFGLGIDYKTLGTAVFPAAVAAVLTVLGNIIAGFLAGRATNHSGKQSMNIGTGIIARGEFAVITANLAEAAGLSPVLQPFTALYVLILAFAAPWLAKNSQKIFGLVSKAKLSSVRS